MKKHLQLVSIGRNPHRIRTVCGCGNLTAVFVADVTCRRCLQSAARLIDDGLAEVSKIYRIHKDKTRTVIGEELALRCQNDKRIPR
jgi:hypothetical protein